MRLAISQVLWPGEAAPVNHRDQVCPEGRLGVLMDMPIRVDRIEDHPVHGLTVGTSAHIISSRRVGLMNTRGQGLCAREEGTSVLNSSLGVLACKNGPDLPRARTRRLESEHWARAEIGPAHRASIAETFHKLRLIEHCCCIAAVDCWPVWMRSDYVGRAEPCREHTGSEAMSAVDTLGQRVQVASCGLLLHKVPEHTGEVGGGR